MDAQRRTAVLIGVGLFLLAPGPLTAGTAGAASARPQSAARPQDLVATVEVTAAEPDPDVSALDPDVTPAGPEVPAVEPEVGVVGAKRGPRAPTSAPPAPAPVDRPEVSPPPPPPAAPPPPPPPPEPVRPEAPPTPPVTAPEFVEAPPPPQPLPPARAPAGQPSQAPRLPTTGPLGARVAALAGVCLALGGLFIAGGARRGWPRPLEPRRDSA